jgi:hypothetical protein
MPPTRQVIRPMTQRRDPGGVPPQNGGNTDPVETPRQRRVRCLRWVLAILFVGGAAGVTVDWHLQDRMSCTSSTTDLTVPALSVTLGHEETRHCTARTLTPDDLAPVFVVAGLLLLPDIKRLKFGSFEFERLSAKVDDQTDKLDQQAQSLVELNQSVQQVATDVATTVRTEVQSSLRNTMTVSFGGDAPDPRVELVERYDDLQRIRGRLGPVADGQSRLRQIERRYRDPVWRENATMASTLIAEIKSLVLALATSPPSPGDDEVLTYDELEAELPQPLT